VREMTTNGDNCQVR